MTNKTCIAMQNNFCMYELNPLYACMKTREQLSEVIQSSRCRIHSDLTSYCDYQLLCKTCGMLKFIATRQGSLNNFHRQSVKLISSETYLLSLCFVCQRAPVLKKKKIKTLLISQIYAAIIKNIEFEKIRL